MRGRYLRQRPPYPREATLGRLCGVAGLWIRRAMDYTFWGLCAIGSPNSRIASRKSITLTPSLLGPRNAASLFLGNLPTLIGSQFWHLRSSPRSSIPLSMMSDVPITSLKERTTAAMQVRTASASASPEQPHKRQSAPSASRITSHSVVPSALVTLTIRVHMLMGFRSITSSSSSSPRLGRASVVMHREVVTVVKVLLKPGLCMRTHHDRVAANPPSNTISCDDLHCIPAWLSVLPNFYLPTPPGNVEHSTYPPITKQNLPSLPDPAFLETKRTHDPHPATSQSLTDCGLV